MVLNVTLELLALLNYLLRLVYTVVVQVLDMDHALELVLHVVR